MTTKMTKAQKTTQAAAIKDIARKLNLIAKVMEAQEIAEWEATNITDYDLAEAAQYGAWVAAKKEAETLLLACNSHIMMYKELNKD